MDKSLFFLTLCLCCIWLMVDSAVGNDRLGAFLGTIFPFMSGGSTVSNTVATPVSTENKTDTKEAVSDAVSFAKNRATV